MKNESYQRKPVSKKRSSMIATNRCLSVLLLFLLMSGSVQSQILKPLKAEESVYLFLCSNTTGLQQGFGLDDGKAISSFDFNFHVLIGNVGYNYSDYSGHKVFIGVGAMGLFQAQYGYGFTTEEHQIKLRSDIPMTVFTDGNTGFGRLLQNLSMGIYYEQPLKSTTDQARIGLTLGLNFMALYFSAGKNSRSAPF